MTCRARARNQIEAGEHCPAHSLLDEQEGSPHGRCYMARAQGHTSACRSHRPWVCLAVVTQMGVPVWQIGSQGWSAASLEASCPCQGLASPSGCATAVFFTEAQLLWDLPGVWCQALIQNAPKNPSCAMGMLEHRGPRRDKPSS